MKKSNFIIVKVLAEHVCDCFVKEVNKYFQHEPDPFFQVIGCGGEGYINLINNFTFEETSVEAKILF